jgi:GDP-mannose transporter
VLQHANVETFIVFRSITPLIVAIADPIFRPHVASIPSAKTIGSLVLIFVGALGYTLMDSTFSVTSYGWGALYVTIFCTEMIYVKDVVSHIKLSNWGLVYYNNGIGTIMSIIVVVLTNETGSPRGRGSTPTAEEAGVAEAASQARRRLMAMVGDAGEGSAYSPGFLALTGIVVSCIFGLGISFFGFSVRRKISATAFTVMGCTNKLLTLLVNTLVWDKHASLAGQASLLVCIAGGVLYGELSKSDAESRKKKQQLPGPDSAPSAEAAHGGRVDVEMESHPGGKQQPV